MTRGGGKTAGVVPPPLIFLLALGAGAVAGRLMPARLFDGAWIGRVIGGILIVLGLTISAWMVRHFQRAGTPVSPLKPVRALIVAGPYRFSRNPDYLGQALLACGIAVAFNSAWMLGAQIPALVAVRYYVIAREEAYLRSLFGDEYEAYAQRVGRWFGTR